MGWTVRILEGKQWVRFILKRPDVFMCIAHINYFHELSPVFHICSTLKGSYNITIDLRERITYFNFNLKSINKIYVQSGMILYVTVCFRVCLLHKYNPNPV